MFSNDKNIETIGQLAEVLKHYIGLQTEYMKLDVVEKVMHLITVLALSAVLGVLLMLALIYLSFAAAHALSSLVGTPWAFAIVGGCYLMLLVLFVIFRKAWIERPVVKLLASILLEK